MAMVQLMLAVKLAEEFSGFAVVTVRGWSSELFDEFGGDFPFVGQTFTRESDGLVRGGVCSFPREALKKSPKLCRTIFY